MKLILKIIVSVIALIVLAAVLLSVKAALTPAAPRSYTETVKTGGEIEAAYLKNGSHDVSYLEVKISEDFEKYEIWYPADLADSNDRFPLIIMLNGTGVKASKYQSQFRHYASWGFIVIGTEETESWDGIAAEKSLEYMLQQNNDSSSIFFRKIDTENIGAMGHSQGGAGVFNAITEHDNSDLYKTAVSLSPTNEQQTAALSWHYDLSLIDIPVFLLAGTKGDFEMELVLPQEAMRDMYGKISAPKAMARKLDCEHGEMLYSSDGYATAWFMWQLQADMEAAEAFTGSHPELMNNSLYTEQALDLLGQLE